MSRVAEELIDLAVPPNHPLAQRFLSGDHRPVQLSELRDESFIVLKKGQGFRKIVFDVCKEAGFEPRVVFESNNIETIQSLVATGMGVTFVPHYIAMSATPSEFFASIPCRWLNLSPKPYTRPRAPQRTLSV